MNRIPRRRSLAATVISVAVAATLALTACGSSSPANQATASTGTPVKGGNLTVAVPGDPQSLDMVANPGQVTAQLSNMIFEKLFEVDKNFQARPMLVDTQTVSPDRLSYTFTLRKGVTFHDGSALSSADVVASLQRWLRQHTTGKGVAPDVDSLTASDASTVVLKLKKPRYPIINELASPGAEIYKESVLKDLPATGFTSEHVVGTGPYKLKTWSVGQQIVLERYTGYASRSEEDWGGQAGAKHAYLDTVMYKVVTDEDAAVNGLVAGQWSHMMPSNDKYETLKANPAVVVHTLGGSNINEIIPNLRSGTKFADPKAREALNLLLDKKALNAATGGSGDITKLDGASASDDNSGMYSTKGSDTYNTFDPEKAKQLFAEAGIKSGDTIRIVTTSTYPQFGQWAVLLQDSLSKIGIQTKIDTYDFPTMLGTLRKDPTGWDITTLFFNGALTSPAQMPALTLNDFNGSGSAQMSALLNDYNAASSPEAAKKVMDQIQELVWKEFPVVTISQSKVYAAYSPKLKGYDNFYRIFWNAWLEP